MSRIIRLAGISGSLRKESFNTFLLHEVSALLPADTVMEILSIGDLPLYNADLDIPSSATRPAQVDTFRQKLADADGLVIASPEYNYSIPGGLKNAIDWASRGKDAPLLNKPIALMGATTGLWGTVRMQAAFFPVFTFLNMNPVLKPEILIAQAQHKFNSTGKLTDENAKELIKKKLQGLIDIIMQEKLPPAQNNL